MANVLNTFQAGNHAGRPTSGLAYGSLYACTTHSLIYQTTDDGATWGTWATLGDVTGSNPNLTTIELGHASDTTLARASAGNITVEGNAIYRAGGTDVPVTDGGTGASTKAAGFDALSPMTTSGDVIYGGASGTGTRLAKGSDGDVLTLASGVPSWAAPAAGGSSLLGVNYRGANGTNYSTTSATQADIDASNSAVTFTAPASGNVLVRMTAPINISANQTGFFGIRESTTDIGPARFAQVNSGFGTRSVTWLITGIAGGSHTYKSAFSVSGGATLTIFQEGAGAGNGGIMLEVWSAP